MLFNSLPFIFVFMPLTAIVYFLLNKRHLTLFANIALIVASFIFYGLGDIHSVRVMLGSILVNFAFTSQINRLKAPSERKGLLIVGIIFNVALLCYYSVIISTPYFSRKMPISCWERTLIFQISFCLWRFHS
mgnify:CR=1 FL=1